MTKVEKLYTTFLECRLISTDTRKIEEGCIFFALKGENFNGNRFALDALKKGAAYVVVDEERSELPKDKSFLVPDVLSALQELARMHRRQLKCVVVGLTGSNGKTTCKELFRDVLAKKYNTHATKGNLNNHIGVPLTILGIAEDIDVAVIEMGANHQKEIAFLSSVSQPDWGYITNYGKAHLEGFGGVEGVIKGKSELYDYLRANEKKALVNGNDALQMEKSKGLDRIVFGRSLDADITIKPVNGNFAGVELNGVQIQSRLTGDFQYSNLAAAAAMGLIFNIPVQQIKEAIEAYEPKMNRSEWRKTEKNEVLLDAYNANPDSTAAAIDAFANLRKTNPWYVLGDMFELGEYATEEHQKIVAQLQGVNATNVLLVGAHYLQAAGDIFPVVATTQEAQKWLAERKLENCSVLLKGSRGMALERLLEVL